MNPKARALSPAYLLATALGSGYSPFGPGTAGSLVGLVIAIVLHQYAGAGRGVFLLLVVLLLAPGIWAAGKVAEGEGRQDPQIVVIDEVLGQWVALLGTAVWNWKSFLAAFVLFRLFDIWKPPPARQSEALHGGLGIVADDLIAGLYGALAIFLLDRLRLF